MSSFRAGSAALPLRPADDCSATDIVSISDYIHFVTRHFDDDDDDNDNNNNNNNNNLLQRLSVLIQRYNAVAIQGTFAHTTSEDEF